MTLREILELIEEPIDQPKPGASELRNCERRIDEFSGCELYANGYAVYDIGDRKTVVKLSDCQSYTYRFSDEVVTVDLLDMPWYCAVALIGEDRIQANASHSESRLEEWHGAANFGKPEAILIRKETMKEIVMILSMLPDEHAESYVMYHWLGYKEQEIADMLGVTQQAVSKRLQCADKEIQEMKEIYELYVI